MLLEGTRFFHPLILWFFSVISNKKTVPQLRDRFSEGVVEVVRETEEVVDSLAGKSW